MAKLTGSADRDPVVHPHTSPHAPSRPQPSSGLGEQLTKSAVLLVKVGVK